MATDKAASKKFEIINNTWVKVPSTVRQNSYGAIRIDSIRAITVSENGGGFDIYLSMNREYYEKFSYASTEIEQFHKDLKTLEDLLFYGK